MVVAGTPPQDSLGRRQKNGGPSVVKVSRSGRTQEGSSWGTGPHPETKPNDQAPNCHTSVSRMHVPPVH